MAKPFNKVKKGKTLPGSRAAKITKVTSHSKTGAPKTTIKNSARGLRNPKAPGSPVKGVNSKSIKYSSKNLF